MEYYTLWALVQAKDDALLLFSELQAYNLCIECHVKIRLFDSDRVNYKMRQILSCAFITVILSACAESSQNTSVFPAPTFLSSPTTASITTLIAIPSKTPLPLPSLTPVPPSLILTDFPLAMDATWKYSAEISYQDPNDYTKTATWSGFVTDKIVGKEITTDGKIVFALWENLEPTPPREVWRQSSTYEYIVTGDGIFEGVRKIYQWPLSDNLSWKAFSDFEYYTNARYVGKIKTPYGELNKCYSFLIVTNPDVSEDIFCPGIGFIMHSYRHFGTPQDEHFELVSYKPGQ